VQKYVNGVLTDLSASEVKELNERLSNIPDPIIAWRSNASLSRLDFCTSLVRLNILTKDQALATIDGVWPEPMLNFLGYLDADQAFEVQMEWKAAVTVQRNHPFILSLGSWLGLTTAQLDAMFGWVGA
jgi:hypothetical protein